MINTLTIRRFKSIRELRLQCRKVNVFIGAPDTGKTNILEALELLSRHGWDLPLESSLRLSPFAGFDPLFYRQFFDKPIEISVNSTTFRFVMSPDHYSLGMTMNETANLLSFRFYSYAGSEVWLYESSPGLPWIVQDSEQQEAFTGKVVCPPNGQNLMYVARHNSVVNDFLRETVSALDWKLRFDQNQNRFVLSEIREDEILDYNLGLLSDSLKRMFFYGSILLSTTDAVLIFDEPDVFAFPPYPKTLGEMIGKDETNQVFVTTHNPYFLSGLVQKTPRENLGIFVCFRDNDGSTGARLLDEDEVERVIEQGASVFFNLEDFAGE